MPKKKGEKGEKGEWWNGGWQRWGKGSWDGEKESAFRKNDNGSVTLIKKLEGVWVDGAPLAEGKTEIKTIAEGKTEIKTIEYNFTANNDEGVYVRVTHPKSKSKEFEQLRGLEAGELNYFLPIEHTNESASDKAFRMEDYGARHLFTVYDGISYPSKHINGFYNFVSDKIYKGMCWLNGKEEERKKELEMGVKIEFAPFPGHLGALAARAEYRNVSEFSITEEDVLSIPVWLVLGRYHRILKSIEIIKRNEANGRVLVFKLDFTAVFVATFLAGRHGEMLRRDDVSDFLRDNFEDESEPTGSIKRKFSEET